MIKKIKKLLKNLIILHRRNRLKNSRFLKYIPGIMVLLVFVGLFTFYYLFNTYKTVVMIENNGYMLKGNSIIEELKKNDSEKKLLETVSVNENDYIYKTNLNHYLDNNKKNTVDIDYPLFINDGVSLVNYNSNINLIDINLERSIGYKNSVLSYGSIYNLNDYSVLNTEKYLLLSYSNGIFINLYDLRVTTEANEYIIPLNSFIYFDKDEINYFEREESKFIKKKISGFDYNSVLEFYFESNNESYIFNHDDFLEKIGSLYKEKVVVPEKPIITEEEQIKEVIPIDPVKQDESFEWVKPKVVASDLSANVYTINGKIEIDDPAHVITKQPSFILITGNKIYSRRSVSSSGDFQITGLIPDTEFQIVGEYIYLNEDLKSKTIVTFYSNTIKTLDLSTLGSIDIKFENGSIYSRSIELATLQITSSLDSEVIRGINNVAITVNNQNYFLSKKEVNSLIRGEKITNVKTTESFNSNTEYDYEVNFFDRQGNKLPVNNNSGHTKTSSKSPTASLKIIKTEVDHLEIGINLKNDDKLKIDNYKYVVSNTAGAIITSGLITDNKLTLYDLDPNQLFNITVYGDYDINDGNGIKKNNELASMDFSSLPITSLGYFNFDATINNITSDSVNLTYKLNRKTDSRLIPLLTDLSISLYTTEDNKFIKEFKLSNQEIDNLKTNQELTLEIDNLLSNTSYYIEFSSKVKQGSVSYDLECLHNLDNFETKKRSADVIVANSFTTNNMIDIDTKVVDLDNSILVDYVRVELRNISNKLVEVKTIDVNTDDYIRITFDNLNANENYIVLFIADEYNETSSSITYESKHELLKIDKYTEEGISGKLELIGATREPIGNNLVDIYSETKWMETFYNYTVPKTVDKNGNMHIYSKGGPSVYAYDLSDYHDEMVTATFKIKVVKPLNEAYKIYFCNYLEGGSNSTRGIELTDLKEDSWTSFTYTFRVGSYRQDSNRYFPDI